MTKEEKDEFLEKLERLEQSIRGARALILSGNIILPCSQVHQGMYPYASDFRIGDFIIHDTSRPIVSESCLCQ